MSNRTVFTITLAGSAMALAVSILSLSGGPAIAAGAIDKSVPVMLPVFTSLDASPAQALSPAAVVADKTSAGGAAPGLFEPEAATPLVVAALLAGVLRIGQSIQVRRGRRAALGPALAYARLVPMPGSSAPRGRILIGAEN